MATESEIVSAIPEIGQWAIDRMDTEVDACRLMLSAMIKIYVNTHPADEWRSIEDWIITSVRQGFNYYRKLKAH